MAEESKEPVENEITESDFQELEAATWMEYQHNTRANIDTALYAWSVIGEMDVKDLFIMENKLKTRLLKAQKQTLEILFKNIDTLYLDEFPEDDEATD